jgi:iron complex outermembrane receptor protein
MKRITGAVRASPLALAAALIGAAGGAAGGAMAQQVPPAPSQASTVGEVVVTAERRSENIQAVPASVTALTSQELRARGVTDIEDIARLVPSVNFGSIGYGTQITARGIGMDLVGGEGESSVVIQLDGIPLLRPAEGDLAQEDLERVELLLGPQGTLYGRNATGGVLNLITNDAKPTFGAGITGGIGNFHAWNVQGYVTGPLNDEVRARLFVSHDNRDGFLYDTYNGERLQNLDNTTVRLTVDVDPAPWAAIQLRAFDFESQTNGPVYKPLQAVPGLPASSYDLRPWDIAADSGYDTRRWLRGGSAKAVFTLSPHATITTLSGYLHFHDDQNYDSDGTALSLFDNSRPQDTDQFTQEVLFQNESGRLKETLGAFYMHEHIDDVGLIVRTPGYTPINGLSALIYPNTKSNDNASIYGDATYQANSRFKVYGGLRGIFDHHELDTTNALVFGSTVIDECTPNDPAGHERSSNTALTGRLGGQFDVDETSNVYGTLSRGYKSGGFNSASCANAYAPETLNAAEIGSKNLFFDRRLLLNASAFFYDFKNLQIEQIVDTASLIDNVPKSRVYGVDGSFEWKASSRIAFSGNLSLLHARYTNFFYEDQLNEGAGNQNLAGRPLNRSPNASGNAGADYTQPIPWGVLVFRADLYATSKFALVPPTQSIYYQSGYKTVAGSITYVSPDQSLRIKGWVKNATNQAYLEGMFVIPIFNLGREGVYGLPRTFGVELTKTFP